MAWLLLAVSAVAWWLARRQDARGYVDGRWFTADQWSHAIGGLGILFWVGCAIFIVTLFL